jgi:hypothetical protein
MIKREDGASITYDRLLEMWDEATQRVERLESALRYIITMDTTRSNFSRIAEAALKKDGWAKRPPHSI